MKKRTCKLDGCDTDARIVGLGYCGPHYRRMLKYGDPRISPGSGNTGPIVGSEPCSSNGCGKPRRSMASGLCRGHSQMLASHGCISTAVAELANFGRHLAPDAGGCWIWTGSRMGTGGIYGQFQRARYAHRVSWEIHKGEIPAGMDLDHLCRNMLCVNPDHLDVVPHAMNNARRFLTAAQHRSLIN